MRAIFVMLIIASAVTADTRVLKDEAMAMVDALAKKYDCHVQEANLVDTLGNINKKNADGQAALKKQCQGERAAAGQAKEEAAAKAVTTYINATGKLEAKLNKALSHTTDQLAKVTREHADKVAAAVAGEQAAIADFDAKKKEWIKETDEWLAAGLNYSATVEAAELERNNTIDDAGKMSAKSDQFAEAEKAEAVVDAQKQQSDTVTGTCEPIFSSDVAMLNRDNATIGEVGALCKELELCKAKKGTAGQGSHNAGDRVPCPAWVVRRRVDSA
jgi:hypothetical protein